MNFPWTTKLELMGTETAPLFLDLLTAGTGGDPGWEVTCTFPLVGKITETCTSHTSGANLENDAAENDALSVFEHELANCTAGGANSGFVESAAGDESGLIVLTGGEALSVSYL